MVKKAHENHEKKHNFFKKNEKKGENNGDHKKKKTNKTHPTWKRCIASWIELFIMRWKGNSEPLAR